MRLRFVSSLALVYLGAFPVAIAATGGDVDPGFEYPNPAQPIPDSTNAVGMPDGGLVVITSRPDPAPASTSTLDLARIDAHGTPVAAFGSPDGRLRVNLPLRLNVSLAAARDAAGNILLGGHELPGDAAAARKAAMVRLDAHGALDPTFGNQGIVLFDSPTGQDDRFEQVAVLPDGRIVAGVRVDYHVFLPDFDCVPELASLLLFDSAGQSPTVLTQLDNTQVALSTCANPLTLSVQPDGEILVGNQVGIRALQPPHYTTVITLSDPPRDSGFTGDAGSFLAGMTAAYVYGSLLRLYRDDPNEPNRGLWIPHRSIVDAPALPLLALAGFDGHGEMTVSSIEQASFGTYVGFSDLERAGVARFNGDGTVRTDWGDGDGVVPVPAGFGSEGAGLVRKLFVQPNDDVIVVTSSGFVRKLLGVTGVARGGYALELASGVAESAATYNLRVSRTGGSSGSVAVSYSVSACDSPEGPACLPGVSNTPAAAGLDFEAATGQLVWGDGESGEKTITVQLLEDNEPESAEYFFVRLLDPTEGSVVLAGTTQVWVGANDQVQPPPPSPAGQGNNSGGGGGAINAWLLALLALLVLQAAQSARRRAVCCPRR